MLPAALQPHTLTHVVAATTTNGYGSTDRDYGEAATRTTFQGRLQQNTRATSHESGRDLPTEQTWMLFTNYTPLAVGDRVEWDDHPSGVQVVFEVWGPPEPAYDRSELHHMEATLRVWTG